MRGACFVWLAVGPLLGCEVAEGNRSTAAGSSASAAATSTATAAAAGEVVFDPNNPPPGWIKCHRNHCHHQDGHVGSYAQVMAEMGATRIAGQAAPKQMPPAPPDVGSIPMNAEKSETGLVSRVISKGTGTEHPTEESTVTVHYTGWTTAGKAFDSSVVRNKPARFPLSRIFPGWKEGIQLMVVGEERRFWLTEELAFNGAPGKPKGTVVFDLELIAIDN